MDVYTVSINNSINETICADGPREAIRKALSNLGYVGGAFKIAAGNTTNNNIIVITPDKKRAYFIAKIDKTETKNCSKEALHQSWFSSMELVYEYFERQIFFDKASRCFYDVFETNEGGVGIKEISPSHPEYEKYVDVKNI